LYPFACEHTALSSDVRKRHFEELGPELRARQKSIRELQDGFEFEFPSDIETFHLIAEWVAGERLCCPFFDIVIHVERGGGGLWLRLTGGEGLKQFIRTELSSWVPT
jgi:hypothetical protein